MLDDLPAIPQSRRLDGPPTTSAVSGWTGDKNANVVVMSSLRMALVDVGQWKRKHVVFDLPLLGNVSPGLQEMRRSTNCPRELVRTKVEVGSSSLGSSGS